MAFVLGGAGAACSLFTDLGGYSGGGADPGDATTDGASSGASSGASGTSGTSGTSGASGGSSGTSGTPPSDSGVTGVYERSLELKNVASTAAPAGSPVCVILDGDVATEILGKVRADFADLRVLGPTTERDRTVDLLTADRLEICFRLERAIALGGTDTDYALRYGDPGAMAPPPAQAKVFDFYDGFDAPVLDPARWLVNGAPVVAGGVLRLPMGSTQPAVTTVAASDTIPPSASLEVRARVLDPTSEGLPQPNGGSFYYWFGFQHTGNFEAVEPWTVFIARSKSSVEAEHKTTSGTCAPGCDESALGQTASFRTYRIDRSSGGARFVYDDGTVFEADGDNGDMSVMLRSFLATSDVEIDWVRARPLVGPDPEPLVGPEGPAP
jgi:hypothetical protein